MLIGGPHEIKRSVDGQIMATDGRTDPRSARSWGAAGPPNSPLRENGMVVKRNIRKICVHISYKIKIKKLSFTFSGTITQVALLVLVMNGRICEKMG